MLQAIILNKAGRNISSDEIHWKELFKASEDSLTSTIFGLLFYLPNELFWNILLQSCYGDVIPDYNSQIINYMFWPRWDAKDSANSFHVEPDLFIETLNYNIIIEAKRYDYNQQKTIQWRTELQAYINEYGDTDKEVYLIALGGIRSEETEILKINEFEPNERSFKVVKCRWSRILQKVKTLHSKLERDRFPMNSVISVFNILDDIILGFRIHGYNTGEWFEQFPNYESYQIKQNSLDLIATITPIRNGNFKWIDLNTFNIDPININLLQQLKNEQPFKRAI
jgi:hypothetical protein